jgi:hypothetical protein
MVAGLVAAEGDGQCIHRTPIERLIRARAPAAACWRASRWAQLVGGTRGWNDTSFACAGELNLECAVGRSVHRSGREVLTVQAALGPAEPGGSHQHMLHEPVGTADVRMGVGHSTCASRFHSHGEGAAVPLLPRLARVLCAEQTLVLPRAVKQQVCADAAATTAQHASHRRLFFLRDMQYRAGQWNGSRQLSAMEL